MNDSEKLHHANTAIIILRESLAEILEAKRELKDHSSDCHCPYCLGQHALSCTAAYDKLVENG